MYMRVKEFVIFWARRCKGYVGIPKGAVVKDWANCVGATPIQLGGLVFCFGGVVLVFWDLSTLL